MQPEPGFGGGGHALSSLGETEALPAADFRDLMACWPTGVTVVTSSVGNLPIGCTVNAIASVSADPPLLLVSLASRSRTLVSIRNSGGSFGVCVLSSAQRDLAKRFACGDPVERFAGVAYTWVMGVPVLRGAVTGAVCKVRAELPVADHTLVIGGPQWQAQDLAHSPAIWFQRAYWELCPADPGHSPPSAPAATDVTDR